MTAAVIDSSSSTTRTVESLANSCFHLRALGGYFGDGQSYHEPGSAALRPLAVQGSSMHRDYLPTDVEAEPHASGAALPVGLEVLLEDHLTDLPRDPVPVITHGNLRPNRLGLRQAHLYGRILGRKLHGVVQEVREHLLHAQPIDRNAAAQAAAQLERTSGVQRPGGLHRSLGQLS